MLCQRLLSQGKKTIDNLFRSIKIILIRKIFLLKLFMPRWTWLGHNSKCGYTGISGVWWQGYAGMSGVRWQGREEMKSLEVGGPLAL